MLTSPTLGNQRILYPAVAIFLVVTLLYSWTYLSTPQSLHHFAGKGSLDSKKSFDGTWDYGRDANNLRFTDAQCDAAFPGLFKEIDRSVEHRRNKHITIEEIEGVEKRNGYVRGLIYDGRVSTFFHVSKT